METGKQSRRKFRKTADKNMAAESDFLYERISLSMEDQDPTTLLSYYLLQYQSLYSVF